MISIECFLFFAILLSSVLFFSSSALRVDVALDARDR